MSTNAPEHWKPKPITQADVDRLIPVVRLNTAKTRLAAAREDYRRMMARVIPTPTYDAVAQDLGYDPRMS